MAQFIIENALTCTSNIEEVLEVLTTLIHFTNKDALLVVYEKKVLEVLESFCTEITKSEFDVRKENIRSHPPFLPKNAGKALTVIARSNRMLRLKKLVEFCEFIPSLELSDKVNLSLLFLSFLVSRIFAGYRHVQQI